MTRDLRVIFGRWNRGQRIFKMYIISGPVVSVNATKIYVQPSKDSNRQLTVYANRVDTPATNLMILACPTPQSIAFETVPKEIFTQCADSFASYESSMDYSMNGFGLGVAKSTLKVHSHGSLKACA